ncbi:hypothetical protein Bca52824_082826 [Brassica carinata]|uniref:Uncharacterized protein n=1 Tax=Brassica carinata TaxID=52824 RepID=A0A8X7TSA4_BRACI|nr:hypothetical protein Bca52824_082826 [Brassica carinata]
MFLYIIGLQGLDPRTTTKLFSKVQFCGEKRIEDNDDSVLKISADRDSLIEQNDAGAPTESGLLIYLEDLHLIRVTPISLEDKTVFWETTTDRGVEGVAATHCVRAIATVFRFGETSLQYSRTRIRVGLN